LIKLNMILQGKGGVGKSLIAAFLAQHYLENGITPICIDTDPVNATFAGYKALNVHRIELMAGDDIDPLAFDELIERVMAENDKDTDRVFVVDNGASSFIPLCSWMIQNEVIQLLKDADVQLAVHCVIAGGPAHGDTVLGFTNLLKHFDVPLVVWLNEYFGKPELNGTAFEDSTIVQNNYDKIHALIRIAAVNPKTVGHALANILGNKQTFKEAMADSSISIMARQRLIMLWRDLNAEITAANL